MRLTDILNQACIEVSLDSATKQEAILALVDLLCQHAGIDNKQELFDAVWHREQTRTTGIGHGIAIPHGKCSGCKNLCIAVAKPAVPLDFSSIDGRPVDLIILLASPPDQTGPHIEALATISRLLSDTVVRGAIAKATTAQGVYEILAQRDP